MRTTEPHTFEWISGAILLGLALLVSVPNHLRRVERDRSQRTSAAIRALANAVEAYAADRGAYPRVSSADALVPLLTPVYARTLVTRDGWGRPLMYRYRACGDGGYAVASAAGDGVFQPDARRHPRRLHAPPAALGVRRSFGRSRLRQRPVRHRAAAHGDGVTSEPRPVP